MHAPNDKQRKTSDRTEPKGWAGFLILPAIVALVLIVLAAFYPQASIWISEAVQAEYGGSGPAGGMPVQNAQPDMAIPMRTVHAK